MADKGDNPSVIGSPRWAKNRSAVSHRAFAEFPPARGFHTFQLKRNRLRITFSTKYLFLPSINNKILEKFVSKNIATPQLVDESEYK